VVTYAGDLSLLARPHRIRPVVSAWVGSGTPTVLPVKGCIVTKDAGAYPRTKSAITIADLAYLPDTLDSLLLPWRTRVKIEAEVAEGDTPIRIPVTQGWLYQTQVTRPASEFTVSVADFSSRIASHTIEKPYTPAATTKVRDVIKRLVRRTSETYAAAMQFDAAVPDDQYGDLGAISGNPWEAIERLADTVGCEVFVRYDDVMVMRPIPSLGTSRSRIAVGGGGLLVASNTVVERQVNRVVIRFDGQRKANGQAAPPVYGVWQVSDTSPTSPTKGYGYVTVVESRSVGNITQAQANRAALHLGRRTSGQVRTTEVTSPALPHLEPGDTVDIGYPTGVGEKAVVQSHVIDLSPSGSSRVKTRSTTWLET
jgi:hypothetical protein